MATFGTGSFIYSNPFLPLNRTQTSTQNMFRIDPLYFGGGLEHDPVPNTATKQAWSNMLRQNILRRRQQPGPVAPTAPAIMMPPPPPPSNLGPMASLFGQLFTPQQQQAQNPFLYF